jgi:hypothetical protein
MLCPSLEIRSRWAYATLEELPDARCTQCTGCLGGTACLNPWLLSRGRADGRPGGGKARRSDGSEIVVEATTWAFLADACEHAVECPCAGARGNYADGYSHIYDDDRDIRHEDWISCRPRILAAWNAEYGIPTGDPCDHCDGSGSVRGVDEHGDPDDPDLSSPCSRCGGTGTAREHGIPVQEEGR